MGSQAPPTYVQRRRVLRSVGAITAAGVAGCVGGQPESPGASTEGTPSPAPSPDTSQMTPSAEFSVSGRSCGSGENSAGIRFDDGTITVDGTTAGRDTCDTATLRSTSEEEGRLTVDVVTERDASDDRACAQCITDIEYRATIYVRRTPDEVVVTHDGETVATERA